jgi:cytoskeletal protein RodZ
MKHTISALLSIFILLTVGVAAYAQENPPDSKRASQQEQPPKHPDATTRQPEVNPPSRQEETKPPKPQAETKPPKTEKHETSQPSNEQQKPTGKRGASAQEQRDRPAGKSAHIPDPQFKANFGRHHTFAVNRVVTTTTIVPNQTQFAYAGYTFIFLDPWPADWLFSDDCYVDYVNDEYYLFDVLHPGVGIALFVVG